jgi:8-oxo-dGTP pyrophosphatase MutT (NUDIX family)
LHVNETPIEALKRECLEEAFVLIKDIELVKVVESDYFLIDNPTYMLFYI